MFQPGFFAVMGRFPGAGPVRARFSARTCVPPAPPSRVPGEGGGSTARLACDLRFTPPPSAKTRCLPPRCDLFPLAGPLLFRRAVSPQPRDLNGI